MIDSSALIAVLRREPDADVLLRAMADLGPCLLSSVSLLETSMVLADRTGGRAAWQGLDALLLRAQVEVVSHDAAVAEEARSTFLRFGKGRHPAALNSGDCASYALAKTRRLSLLFKGDNFARTDLTAVL